MEKYLYKFMFSVTFFQQMKSFSYLVVFAVANVLYVRGPRILKDDIIVWCAFLFPRWWVCCNALIYKYPNSAYVATINQLWASCSFTLISNILYIMLSYIRKCIFCSKYRLSLKHWKSNHTIFGFCGKQFYESFVLHLSCLTNVTTLQFVHLQTTQ